MTPNERVREIRKALGLTLEKFGEKLGIKKAAVSKIETGENSLTEGNIKSICREFHVNYIWLTTGAGEMFLDSDDDFKEQIDQIMSDETDMRKNFFKFLLTLSDDDIKEMDRLMRKAFEFFKDSDDTKNVSDEDKNDDVKKD